MDENKTLTSVLHIQNQIIIVQDIKILNIYNSAY